MALTTSERNGMLTTETGRLLYLSAHTADPGSTGTSEASGGSPAYARKSLAWGTAASGSISASQVSFDLPAGTYTHVGFWSAVTGGTFLGGAALATSQVLSSQGILQVTPSFTQTSS